MPQSVFLFKQFAIRQDQCAMKVGTDGVLLGAWAKNENPPKTILDIGTGTGLVALMLAQRFPDAKITALEIDKNAAEQAAMNAELSPFKNNVSVLHADYFDWECNDKFDIVACNPPFYAHAHPAKNAERSVARHGARLQIPEFMEHIEQHLSENGTLSMIMPVHVFEEIKNETKLYPHRICNVYPNPEKPAHRILAEWRKFPGTLTDEKIILENGQRHDYHPDYVALTKEFYLKF